MNNNIKKEDVVQKGQHMINEIAMDLTELGIEDNKSIKKVEQPEKK